MKVLLERFWNEPAVAISTFSAVATALVILLIKLADGQSIDGVAVAEIAVALGLPIGGGAAIRSQVTPVHKGRRR